MRSSWIMSVSLVSYAVEQEILVFGRVVGGAL
jgi:hypothetical protein